MSIGGYEQTTTNANSRDFLAFGSLVRRPARNPEHRGSLTDRDDAALKEICCWHFGHCESAPSSRSCSPPGKSQGALAPLGEVCRRGHASRKCTNTPFVPPYIG